MSLLFKVGTRSSRLSLIQTQMVIEQIMRVKPGVEIQRTTIATSGDRDTATPLYSLSEKGIFEKEVDDAVLDGRVDFAVHSMKDVPTLLSPELVIASIPERGPTADVLVSKDARTLMEIREGGRVGTSSLLRSAQLRRIRPGLRVEPIRGNVDTRVSKVESGEFDGAILAEAGLARLGMVDKITETLSLDDFVPAPGQGALAVVARRGDSELLGLLKRIEHAYTRAEVEAERELVRILEGGCKVPIGALGATSNESVELTASIFSLDGKQRLVAIREGPVNDPVALGKRVGEDLLEKGAKKIAETWRTVYS